MKIVFKDSELKEGIIKVSLDGGCGYGFRIIESNCPFNQEALYVSNGNVTYTSYTSLKQLCQYDGHFYTLYNDDTKRLSGDLYVKADIPGSCHYESDYIRVPYRLEELNHSRWALEKGGKSYIGDQLRLKLATEDDDFFYADADVFIQNLSDIAKHKNCTDFIPEQNIINNGTFFYTDKDCKFNSYYLNVYNHLPKEDYYLCNYSILKKYPFDLKLESKKSADMNLLDNNRTRHFLLNLFYRFAEMYKDLDVVYYTRNPNTKRPIIWQIENCPPYIGAEHSQEWSVWYFDTIYDFIPQDDLIKLFKEQLNYAYQKKLRFLRYRYTTNWI